MRKSDMILVPTGILGATLAYGPRTLSSLTALISGRTPAAIAESVRRLAAASRLTLSPPAVDPLLSLPEA